jgi:hypothetical protein
MSNKSVAIPPGFRDKEEGFSLAFLWHQTPLKQRAAAITIFVLSISFAFGLGAASAGREERVPIIIKQCAD